MKLPYYTISIVFSSLKVRFWKFVDKNCKTDKGKKVNEFWIDPEEISNYKFWCRERIK